MKKRRIAVIGAGHLGKIHTRLLKSMDEVSLIGVADPVESAREQVANDYDIAGFADYKQLIGQIDAAIVAAPTKLHHQIGAELLSNGIHTFLEKPIAVTVEEADDLVAIAKQKNVVLQVGHVERFNPALTDVQDQLLRPKYIEATRASNYTFRSTDVGVVLDLMIHDIDIALSLVESEVVSVQAMGLSIFGENEDLATAHLQFANGAAATLKASRVSFEKTRAMDVYAERGFARINFDESTVKTVSPNDQILNRELHVNQVTEEQKTEIKDNLFGNLLKLEDRQIERRNAILDEQYDFLISIDTGRQPNVTGLDGRDALDVACQILDSINSHQWSGHSAGPIGPLASPTEALTRRKITSPNRRGGFRKAG